MSAVEIAGEKFCPIRTWRSAAPGRCAKPTSQRTGMSSRNHTVNGGVSKKLRVAP